MNLNKDNFAQILQNVIEETYLQPYDGKPKANLKDGYIERKLFGAMHAARMAVLCGVGIELMQDTAPSLVVDSISALAAFLNTDAETIKLLTMLTAACEACKRTDDYDGLNPEASMEYLTELLEKLGLNERQASIFIKAPLSRLRLENSYESELKKAGITDPELLKHCQFVADALNATNYLNDMNENTVLSNPSQADIDRLNAHDRQAYEEMLINDAKGKQIEVFSAVQQLIHEQHDLQKKSELKDSLDHVIAAMPANFNIAEKVKYEHADNVFSATYAAAEKYEALHRYLPKITCGQTDLATVKPAFHPFVHVTTSAIFTTLPKTDFQLMSMLDMMNDHHAAPPDVKLEFGNHRLYPFENRNLNPRFLRLSTENINNYCLDNALADDINRDYTWDKRNSIHRVRLACSMYAPLRMFTNINVINLYLIRARQLSPADSGPVLPQEMIDKFDQDANAAIQFYWLMQLIGSKIFPDFSKIEKFGKEDIAAAVKDYLTYEKITKAITENHLDVEAVVKDPTPENLQKVLKIFELPEKVNILREDIYPAVEKDITLPSTQLFCLEENHPGYRMFTCSTPDYMFSRITEAADGYYSFQHELANLIIGDSSYDLFRGLGKEAAKFIPLLKERLDKFHELLAAPQDKFVIDEKYMPFIENAFPVVLVTEQDDKIMLRDWRRQDYCSTQPLKIGTDIKLIATDTMAHREEVQNYLRENHVDNVEVVLISGLKASSTTHQWPEVGTEPPPPTPEPEVLPAETDLQSNSLFRSLVSGKNRIQEGREEIISILRRRWHF